MSYEKVIKFSVDDNKQYTGDTDSNVYIILVFSHLNVHWQSGLELKGNELPFSAEMRFWPGVSAIVHLQEIFLW